MTSINGVNSYAAMSELLQAQSKQLGEVMKAAVQSDVDMARKLAAMSAEMQIEASRQDVIGQVVDLYV